MWWQLAERLATDIFRHARTECRRTRRVLCRIRRRTARRLEPRRHSFGVTVAARPSWRSGSGVAVAVVRATVVRKTAATNVIANLLHADPRQHQNSELRNDCDDPQEGGHASLLWCDLAVVEEKGACALVFSLSFSRTIDSEQNHKGFLSGNLLLGCLQSSLQPFTPLLVYGVVSERKERKQRAAPLSSPGQKRIRRRAVHMLRSHG
jgi:hypothetical protein